MPLIAGPDKIEVLDNAMITESHQSKVDVFAARELAGTFQGSNVASFRGSNRRLINRFLFSLFVGEVETSNKRRRGTTDNGRRKTFTPANQLVADCAAPRHRHSRKGIANSSPPTSCCATLSCCQGQKVDRSRRHAAAAAARFSGGHHSVAGWSIMCFFSFNCFRRVAATTYSRRSLRRRL